MKGLIDLETIEYLLYCLLAVFSSAFGNVPEKLTYLDILVGIIVMYLLIFLVFVLIFICVKIRLLCKRKNNHNK